jgi:hypothetical protein
MTRAREEDLIYNLPEGVEVSGSHQYFEFISPDCPR